MGTKIKVLVADSNDDFRFLMADTIAAEDDMEVIGTAGDGLEALRMAEEKRPDVILMDIVLTKLDGLGVLQRLSQMVQAPTAIIVSGFFNEHVVREAAGLGAYYFMPKPCDIPTLLSHVRRAVNSSKNPAQSRSLPSLRPAASLEYAVTEILHELGIPAHIRGYHYLREAIVMMTSDMGMFCSITRTIYPELAETFLTTPSRVERAIRHAIEIAWDRGNIETLQKYFGYTVSDVKGKPTNNEFIAMISDCITLRRRVAQ